MPLDNPSSKASKGKRIKNFGRGLSTTDTEFHLPYSRIDESEIILPIAYRCRLYELFNQIEKDFEVLYTENITLKEKN